jgi:hypothetical protein
MAAQRFASIREWMQSHIGDLTRHSGSIATLVPVWNEVVGPAIARKAQPLALENDVLVVAVMGDSWISALESQAAGIVSRLPARLGVKRLSFVNQG